MELNFNAPTHYAGKVEIYAEVDTVPLSALYAKAMADVDEDDDDAIEAARQVLEEACREAIEDSLIDQGCSGIDDLCDPVCDLVAAITSSPAPDYVYENPSAYKARQRRDRAAERKAACA